MLSAHRCPLSAGPLRSALALPSGGRGPRSGEGARLQGTLILWSEQPAHRRHIKRQYATLSGAAAVKLKNPTADRPVKPQNLPPPKGRPSGPGRSAAPSRKEPSCTSSSPRIPSREPFLPWRREPSSKRRPCPPFLSLLWTPFPWPTAARGRWRQCFPAWKGKRYALPYPAPWAMGCGLPTEGFPETGPLWKWQKLQASCWFLKKRETLSLHQPSAQGK